LQALSDISLDMEDGAFIVFVGPSGCGKSTLLRCIAGLEAIDDGTIEIGEKDVTRLEPSDRELSMVFQSYALYPHMSVRANMEFGMKVNGIAPDERMRRVDEAARILQLTEYLDRKPAQLSGGQRQRVAIGRSIVKDPKVFLFDEPLSNLDAKLRVQMRIELESLHKELGATMIYVTHDQVEAMTMADQIVVLNGGKVEQVGAPLDLYHRPASEFVAGFIGSPAMNIVDVASGLGDGVSARDGATRIGIRPEHIEIADSGVRATITVKEQLGGESYLYTRTDDGTDVVVKSDGDDPHNPGDTLHLALPSHRVHQFGANGESLGGAT
ncbi:MAG: sn-glycerol-3-phosphate ABC transporter ATP-binding protein UgpC, partial [Pseudomonadota bacterium]